MNKSNKSKKTLTIFVLAVITLAFFAACTNPFLPAAKKKEPARESSEVLSVNIVATFDGDGKRVMLTADVSGNSDGGILSYQWYSNTVDLNEDGTAISDETMESYRPPVSPNSTTYYYVEVTNTLNGKTYEAVSSTVKIVVNANGNIEVLILEIETPSVTVLFASDGEQITLTAEASVGDGGEISYQWYSNTANSSEKGKALYGETKAVYAPPSSPNGTVYYYVKATNNLSGQTASAVSPTVKIVVREKKIAVDEIVVSDTVDTPTVSVTAAPFGGSVMLTASASVSDGILSYRWYKNTIDSGRGGTFIAGATGMNYTPPNINGTVFYYVKVTNTLRGQTADAVSNTVMITVEDGEVKEWIVSGVVRTPTVSITAAIEGRNVTLTAAASVTGGGEISYQWYRNSKNSKDGTEIAEATSTTYAPSTETAGTAYYYVRATNTLNGRTASATSNVMGVVVPETGDIEVIEVEIPAASVIASSDGPYNIGAPVMLTATASVSDGGVVSVQWYSNAANDSTTGTAITGATSTAYMPPTDAVGIKYYYVIATNTRDGKTASAASNVLEIEVSGTEIHSASVTVDEPVMGKQINVQAVATGTGYTVGNVAWTVNNAPASGSFLGNTRYTATVTLTANENYTFAETFRATIGVYTAVISNRSATSVTFSHTFTATLSKAVDSVAVTKDPTKKQYVHGEELNLSGTALTVNYTDGTSDSGTWEVLFETLGENLKSTPANSSKLVRTAHNQRTVVIRINDKSDETGSLTVDAKKLTVTAVSHTKVYDGNESHGTTPFKPETWDGEEIFGDRKDVVFVDSVIGVYMSPNAGTNTMGITTGTLSGEDGNNYGIAEVENVPVIAGAVTGGKAGITKFVTQVTAWPGPSQTPITATYGDLLSSITLSGTATGVNGAPVLGVFAWASSVSPTATVGDVVTSRSFAVTFTPTDTTNYETRTGGSANVRVNQKALTIATATHTKTYDTLTTASGITVTFTAGGILPGDSVTASTVTGVYTGANAGTKTISINAVTLTGTRASQYTVTPRDNITVNGNGITKANPTVTWPTLSSPTYGQYLTNITRTGGSATGVGGTSLMGNFNWTTSTPGTTLVGPVENTPQHNMTYTPNDTTNYNTASSNRSITVQPKDISVTVNNSPALNSGTFIPIAPDSFEGFYNTDFPLLLTVSGLVGNETARINASPSYGLWLSNVGNTTTSGTMYYDGTTTVPQTTVTVGLVSANSNYRVSNNPTVTVNVLDGQAADRAIAVKATNIKSFNTYANTSAGLTRHYKLIENVNMSTLQQQNGQPYGDWTPIGTNTAPFTGSFDGQKHTISKFNIPAATYAGMFGYISGATIKNLWLADVNVDNTTNVYAGGIVGYMNGGTVENCIFDRVPSSIVIPTVRGANSIGGLVGYMTSGTVQNCSVGGGVQVYSDGIAGGVVGYMSGGTVQYCTAGTYQLFGSSYTGGVVGNTGNNAIVTKCYSNNNQVRTVTNDQNYVGRVYTGTGTGSYNYGNESLSVRYNNGSMSISFSGNDTTDSRHGETTTVEGNNSYKKTALLTFWTTSANWGGAPWDVSNNANDTTIWYLDGAAMRLRGF